ncbi:hypothetical protein IscW_ISCW000315, partial [Ixodes scapularis]
LRLTYLIVGRRPCESSLLLQETLSTIFPSWLATDVVDAVVSSLRGACKWCDSHILGKRYEIDVSLRHRLSKTSA